MRQKVTFFFFFLENKSTSLFTTMSLLVSAPITKYITNKCEKIVKFCKLIVPLLSYAKVY